MVGKDEMGRCGCACAGACAPLSPAASACATFSPAAGTAVDGAVLGRSKNGACSGSRSKTVLNGDCATVVCSRRGEEPIVGEEKEEVDDDDDDDWFV